MSRTHWMAAAIAASLVGCGGTAPEIRYYQLSAPAAARGGTGPVLVLEPLEAEAAYDDQRIVYRVNDYRLDYYHYHRWSASPGFLVSNYLEQALERSGRFRAVVRQPTAEAGLSLGGRLISIEEVDHSKREWVGRIVIELSVKDLTSGQVVWSRQFDESEPLERQSPEGLARAISTALGRVVRLMAPEVAQLAQEEALRRAQVAPARVR
ncbi:MAG TPA: ABC-type transport auxiliary lipoprotein family protein [Kofleriaceae bacterium]|nr:ABC-type transport auxiliary lipoprotein family protein [Kofleriaceae bacterium]